MKNATSTDVWDSLSLDLVSIQVDGRIVFINAAGAKMLGATASEQLIGKPILDFVHPDYWNIATARAQLRIHDGVLVGPREEKWLRLDGVAIDVEVVATLLLYQGKPAMQLIVRMCSERRPCKVAPNGNAAAWSRRRRPRWQP